MALDISIVKAIIKRSLTDEDLLRNNKRLGANWRGRGKFKRLSLYRAIKKRTNLELKNCLIDLWVLKKNKSQRYEKCIWCYLDMHGPAEKRRSGEARYPSSFLIYRREIDTKMKFLSAQGEAEEEEMLKMDFPFFRLSTHCLERIIQRSQKQTVQDAIKLFKPVCSFFYAVSLWLDTIRAESEDKKPSDQYLIYWIEGYMIVKYDAGEVLPILLTWVPKAWFSEQQFAKFINFETKVKDSSTPFIFNATDFNNKRVLTESDIVDPLKVLQKRYPL